MAAIITHRVGSVDIVGSVKSVGKFAMKKDTKMDIVRTEQKVAFADDLDDLVGAVDKFHSDHGGHC